MDLGKIERVPLHITAEGCEIFEIGGIPPSRISDNIRPDLSPYVPVGEFIALDQGGRFNSTVMVKTGTYESAVPRVDYAKGSKKVRECVLDVRCGAYADATIRVIVKK